MSIEIRRGEDRGHFDFGWLKTYHSFSFGDYFHPDHVQFGPLRVLNEDFVKAGQGFGKHSHRDMEIVTYVLDGAVAHRDSSGGDGTIRAGEVQRMSAGSGVEHSEFNASDSKDLHLLQVWFLPERPSIQPGYQQAEARGHGTNLFTDAVTPTGDDGALKIHQDVVFKILELDRGKSAVAAVRERRIAYLHNAMVGTIELNGTRLAPGDGAKIRGPENLMVSALEPAKVVLFDMADIPPRPPRW